MATYYYRNAQLLITDTEVVRRGDTSARFDINRLQGIYIVEQRGGFFRPAMYELRGTYRGENVLLFRSNDIRAFSQVRRALVRALEHASAGELAEERTAGDGESRKGGRTATLASSTSWAPRDPWLDPEYPGRTDAAGFEASRLDKLRRSRQHSQRWRVHLERILALPLTANGAMTVAIADFDRRMNSLLMSLGDPMDFPPEGSESR